MRERPVWVFDDFEVDLAAWRLLRGGQPVAIEPKALALLALLVERRGEVVTKTEILDQIWKDAAVTENAMVRVIGQIRSALGDDPKEPKYLETVHTRGYRFIPLVTWTVVGSPPTPSPADQGPAEASETQKADVGRTQVPAAARASLPSRPLLAPVVVSIAILGAAASYLFMGGRAAAPAHAPATSDVTRTASIAILPLDNTGPPAHQYFADGMTEALTTQLAKIEALKVISRSAVMRYRGERPRPSVIARELDVVNLVEGSALLTGDRVRITARLVDGATDRTLWAESYEGNLEDVLALQARVAREIAREIRVRVTSEEEDRLSTSRAVNPAAYHRYLQGLYQFERSFAPDANLFTHVREAITHINAALALEPGWGEAHGALAQCHLRLAGMSDDHQERLREYRITREVAERALELDPAVVSARLAFARSAFFVDGDWNAADRQFQEVLRLEPNNANWHYGTFLSYAGRFDEALARLRHCQERWPTSSFVRFWIGLTYICARRYDEAAAEAQDLRDRLQDEVQASLLDGMVLIGRGRYAEAADLLEARRETFMVNRATTFLQQLAYAAAKAGQPDRARRAIRELEALGGRATLSNLLALGETEAAVREIEERYRTRDYTLLQSRCAYEYEAMRRIPAVARIMRDVGVFDPR
jgi:TolB-like protein/DNA-binding winged helix-turn-helix (wHTH) protein/Tfp pilus assembly protein PilF